MRFVGLAVIMLVIVFIASYTPYFYSLYAYNRRDRGREHEATLLGQLFRKCLFVVTVKCGEGESKNSDTKFEQTHKNQQFAVNSVMNLLSEMEE